MAPAASTRTTLAWTVSLALFALGAGALWWAEARGWSLASFRVFYLAGAVLNVPWLALGTVYLLAGRTIGRPGAVVARTVHRAQRRRGAVRADPLGPCRAPNCPRAKTCSVSRRGCSPRLGSGVAAIVIIAGALWSVYRMARRRQPALSGVRRTRRRHRCGSSSATCLIAAGTHRAVGQWHVGGTARQGHGVFADAAVGIVGAVRRVPGGVDDVARTRCGRYINERRSSLPLTLRGSSSTNRIFDGHL